MVFWKGVSLMEKITHALRREYWKNVVAACNTSGMKKQDWLKENNINSKSFYHWQKILREEKGVQLILDHTREQTLTQSLPISTQMTDSSHIDFGVLTPPAVGKSTAVGAVLRSGDLEVEISDDISDDLLHRLIKAMSHD